MNSDNSSCRFSLVAQTRGPWAYYQKLYEQQKIQLEELQTQLDESEEKCQQLEDDKNHNEEQIFRNYTKLKIIQCQFTQIQSQFKQFKQQQQNIISALQQYSQKIIDENKQLNKTVQSQNQQFQALESAQQNWGQKIATVGEQLNLSDLESFYFIQELENLRISSNRQQKQINNLNNDNQILSDKCSHYQEHNAILIEENSRLTKHVTQLRESLLLQQAKNTKLIQQIYGKKNKPQS
eukprot:TRINITY_DN13130_c0_g1_i3.p1 TRINITY_DN13130_c0_g1~~TRINITY_DN13130_c0_g1_i3.p1  ORF type:complete len:249 (+),score=16.09 TRINITY_DN13130_c0_g1_i3:37-747(+)